MGNQNDKSPHILNAASNLLGLCFVVLTSLKLFFENIADYLFLAGIILLFVTTILFSFNIIK